MGREHQNLACLEHLKILLRPCISYWTINYQIISLTAEHMQFINIKRCLWVVISFYFFYLNTVPLIQKYLFDTHICSKLVSKQINLNTLTKSWKTLCEGHVD